MFLGEHACRVQRNPFEARACVCLSHVICSEKRRITTASPEFLSSPAIVQCRKGAVARRLSGLCVCVCVEERSEERLLPSSQQAGVQSM